jgi:hypothetical protein
MSQTWDENYSVDPSDATNLWKTYQGGDWPLFFGHSSAEWRDTCSDGLSADVLRFWDLDTPRSARRISAHFPFEACDSPFEIEILVLRRWVPMIAKQSLRRYRHTPVLAVSIHFAEGFRTCAAKIPAVIS